MENIENSIVKIATLRQSLLDDMFKDFEHNRKKWIRRLLEPFVWPSAHRFAGLMANLDTTTIQSGFREALRELITPFVKDVIVFGDEHIPKDGPLLIVSNHPGTVDSIAIGASLPRDDLSIVATGFPLLRRLPSASRHLIYVDPQAPMNISGVRSTIQQLESGGSVLIFPSGRVEPDPAILPSARQALQNWSPSIELFLRKVPQTRVIVTIVSGVLSPVFLHNPLIRLWRGMRDPLAIAEVSQIVTQLVFKKRFRMTPKISFDIPYTVDDLRRDSESIYQSILAKAYCLMADHLPAAECFGD
jgi:hypothetical protein